MISRRFFLLFVLVASLLGAQQSALAHMVGHLADNLRQERVLQADGDDSRHGSFEALSTTCTTCIALATVSTPAADGTSAFVSGDAAVSPQTGGSPTAASTDEPLPFRTRAPPALQN